MALVSPGVEVTIIDQSQYLPAASNSVPLVILATAQDKANPSGTGIAAGTLAVNANKLYQVTSQRDLVTLFGNPFFYKTTNGTAIQGYELNEYGLLAAYSLLGITNRCFVLRANIDLASLVGQVSRPVGPPADGTFWLDMTSSKFGIFEWNASTGTFTNKVPLPIVNEADVTSYQISSTQQTIYVPKDSVGNPGDYAVVYVDSILNGPTYGTHYGTPITAAQYVFWKSDVQNILSAYYNTWISINDPLFKTLHPSLVTTPVLANLNGGTFFITIYDATSGTALSERVQCTLTGNNLAGLITDINGFITDGRLPYLGVDYNNINPGRITWLLSPPTDAGVYIQFEASSGSTSLLDALGITNTAKNVTAGNINSGNPTYRAWSTALTWGTNAQQPRWRAFDNTPHPSGSIYLKNSAQNNGVLLSTSRYATSTGVFTSQNTNLFSNDAQAIYYLDTTGGKTIAANTTYAQYGFSDQLVNAQLTVYKRAGTGAAQYVGSTALNTTTSLKPGETMTIRYTNAGNINYSNVANVTLPSYAANAVTGNLYAPISNTALITALSNAIGPGAPVIAALSSTGNLVLTHTQGGTILLDDTAQRGIESIKIAGTDTNNYFIPGSLIANAAAPVVDLTISDFDVITTGNGINADAIATGYVQVVGANIANTIGFQTGDSFRPNVTGISGYIAGGTEATLTITGWTGGSPNIATYTVNSKGYTSVPFSSWVSNPNNSSAGNANIGSVNWGNSYLTFDENSVVMLNAGKGYQNPKVTATTATTVRGGYTVALTANGSGYANNVANANLVLYPANTESNSAAVTIGTISTNATGIFTIVTTNNGNNYTYQGTANIVGTAPTAGASNVAVLYAAGIGGGTGATATLSLTAFKTTGEEGVAVLSQGLRNKSGFSASSTRIESFSQTRTITNLNAYTIGSPNTPAIGSANATISVTITGSNYSNVTVNDTTGTVAQNELYYIKGTDLGGINGTSAIPQNDCYFYVGTGTVPGFLPTFITTTPSGVAGVPKPQYPSVLSNFTKFTYDASTTAPSSSPVNGTNWYFSVINQVDIMIQDNGVWNGYRNVDMDVRGYNLTQTDPNGPICTATAPTVQTDGSPLVYGDLWVNTADLENYPQISRWQNVDGLDQWVSIDITDQVTGSGILFQDARWSGSPSTDPINDAIPTIKSMLTSNWVDPDAPNPAAYPEGMLLFNTRRSGYNVKRFTTNYFTAQNYPNDVLPSYSYTWVSVSGLLSNGAPYMGRKAQRALVVQALAASVNTNMNIREEDNFFNLIATPNYPELQPNMITLNNDRNNTAYIVGDTPLRLPDQATAITAWATNAANATSTGEDGLVSRDAYMGLYYPSGLTTDLTGTNVVVPPSHMMLRTILRNDQVAYPWFAPAGTRRGNIDNANSIGYLDAQTGEFISIKNRIGIRDVLYTNQINPLVFFTGVGLLNYGNKNSRDTQSSLDRTNVARLVAYIRERLTVLARPYVFEPNDNQTRTDISGVVTTLLADILSKRGIYDYLVVCDQTNNTPARIDRNELWIDVAIEPVKAVEFIYIPVRILNTGEIAGLAQNG